DEGEAAGVEPALDEEPLHRERHLLARETVDAARGGGGVETEATAEPPERRHRALAVEHDAAAEEVPRVDQSENHERVGDRRLPAPAPVARGPRLGTRATRSDGQHATGIDRGDAAPAGAD